MRRILITCYLGLLSVLTPSLQAEPANPMRAPQALVAPPPSVAPSPTLNTPTLVLRAYIRFFQQVISPVDGARSNMYPTGSDYARQTFAKHGALRGFVLAVERLMHEGNEGQRAPRIRKYGLWRIYDPVEANDWWWQGPHWVYESPRAHTSRR